jgi:hypothetical protein
MSGSAFKWLKQNGCQSLLNTGTENVWFFNVSGIRVSFIRIPTEIKKSILNIDFQILLLNLLSTFDSGS